ncbi:hypothetical protein H6M51_20165 [Rhizobium sp. AQ_MP]|uniref:hypothetical protein n=1 Tax=Rhizobium sp. AQ_MP TaxID=2761536 RepID=UPI00163AF78F|nr:hypothetical protein [Rhizobium sp. AQ_MP]MBC2775181.1 hypothetical protein [Rhizobium sp. AQ_MP]
MSYCKATSKPGMYDMTRQFSRRIVRTSAALAFCMLMAGLPIPAHAQQAGLNAALNEATDAVRIALIEARLEGLGDLRDEISPRLIILAMGNDERLRRFLVDDEYAASVVLNIRQHRYHLNLYISGKLTEEELRIMNNNLGIIFPFLPGIAS